MAVAVQGAFVLMAPKESNYSKGSFWGAFAAGLVGNDHVIWPHPKIITTHTFGNLTNHAQKVVFPSTNAKIIVAGQVQASQRVTCIPSTIVECRVH